MRARGLAWLGREGGAYFAIRLKPLVLFDKDKQVTQIKDACFRHLP